MDLPCPAVPFVASRVPSARAAGCGSRRSYRLGLGYRWSPCDVDSCERRHEAGTHEGRGDANPTRLAEGRKGARRGPECGDPARLKRFSVACACFLLIHIGARSPGPAAGTAAVRQRQREAYGSSAPSDRKVFLTATDAPPLSERSASIVGRSAWTLSRGALWRGCSRSLLLGAPQRTGLSRRDTLPVRVIEPGGIHPRARAHRVAAGRRWPQRFTPP